MRDLSGKHVVVTGTIGGESRLTAEAKLRDAGAVVQSSVGVKTELLVTGGKVGKTKLDAAQKHGAEIVPWEEVWSSEEALANLDPVGYPETDDIRPAPAARPRAIGPMLAKAGELPAGPDWLFEVKWDGLRCIARVEEGFVTMTSRSAKTDYVGQFPQIAALLAQWPNVVMDGELVVLDDKGGSSLASIGNKAGASFIVFDVLELFGKDIRHMTLKLRRHVLDEELKHLFEKVGGDRIAVSPAFEDGEELLQLVIDRGLEGVVAKQRSGRYVEGHRGWIKVKLRNEQEFVVLGWVPGKGALTGKVGGLVLGVRETDRWLYVGRAGSGPTDSDRMRLKELLEPLRLNERHPEVHTGTTPRADLKDVAWVEPELIVNVAFQRWSKDGRLVIPSLKGVRDDKKAIEVTRKP